MRRFVSKLKKLIKKQRAMFPTRLPVGATELKSFCDSIFEIYDLPSHPSYRHAIASMIMHLGPTKDSAPMAFFAKSVRKSMANQVAYDLIDKIREEKQNELKAVASNSGDSSDEQSIQNEGVSGTKEILG